MSKGRRMTSPRLKVSATPGTEVTPEESVNLKPKMMGRNAISSTIAVGARVNLARRTSIRELFARKEKTRRVSEGVVQEESLKLFLTDLRRTVMIGQPCICLGWLTLIFK